MHPFQANTLASCVGQTPLLALKTFRNELSPAVKIFVKAEWFNPSGSFKDRVALNIIEAAQTEGKLRSGMRLLDSTSGNMGIAYATLAPQMGYSVTLVLPENATQERIAILRALGAEVIFSDGAEGSGGAIRLAQEIFAENPEKYFYANQYDNPANWQAHYQSMGPEIFAQTQGEITHLVAGVGTSGTLMGVGRYLKEKKSQIEIVAVLPSEPKHGLVGLKHMASVRQPKIYDPNLPDSFIEIETEDARAMVRRLARQENLLVGPSSGAAALATLQKAKMLDKGIVVTIFPDAGYKYLSDASLWA